MCWSVGTFSPSTAFGTCLTQISGARLVFRGSRRRAAKKIGHQQSRASQEHHSEPNAFPLAKTQVLRSCCDGEISLRSSLVKTRRTSPKEEESVIFPICCRHTKREDESNFPIFSSPSSHRVQLHHTLTISKRNPPSSLLVRTTLV